MAYTTINKSSDHFNTVLYTGDGSASDRTITGVGFQPDFLWNKSRSNAYNHYIFDVLRGTNMISSNATTAQEDKSPQFSAFTSDGFTIRNDAGSLAINASGVTFANWNWKANGAGSANTDGSINSTVSANNTSGFSIVKYTGTGSAGNVGHGLSTAPTFLINKALGVQDFFVGCSAIGFTKFLKITSTNGASTNSGLWNDTAPTTDHFTINSGNGNTNASGVDYITYCFAEKQGFSKFGSYTGNGNADGSFIYTGFSPAFVIIKQSSAAGESWKMYDNKRPGYNLVNNWLEPDDNQAEGTGSNQIDMVSNGFKARASNTAMNASGSTYIFMAFAEAPLVGSNNVPANAR